MGTRFTLLVHANTGEFPGGNEYCYRTDLVWALSDQGFQEALALRKTLDYPEFDLVVADQFARTQSTASDVGGRPPETLLPELGYGNPESDIMGRLHQDMMGSRNFDFRHWAQSHKREHILLDYGRRGWKVLRASVMARKATDILVVGHPVFITALGLAIAENNESLQAGLRAISPGFGEGFILSLDDSGRASRLTRIGLPAANA